MKLGGKTKTRDAILIASLLILAAVLYLLLGFGKAQGGYAIVTVEGKIVERIPLTAEGTYSLNGGSNTLLINSGSARMTEANCPDHICVDSGEIRYEGQLIVCLPNKLVVSIEGVKGEADLYIG